MKVMVMPVFIGALCIVSGPGGFENKRSNRDHPIYSIVKISQNRKKSLVDLMSFKLH